MARIRPTGHCEECPPEEGLKEIVSHNLCAKHNQRRLRAIWRKPEPSDTQKQKLMEKLEKDLIAIKNMCSKWERDGYVAMDLITAETIETFRTELDDYMDFRPTLKSAPPKTELDEALEGHKAPPPMFRDDEVPGQYQFAPVVEKPATPAAAAVAPKQATESNKSASKDIPAINAAATKQEIDRSGGPSKTCKEEGWTFKKRGEPSKLLEIAGVDRAKRQLKIVGSDNPVSFDNVLFLSDPEHPDRNLSGYFATDNPQSGDPAKGTSGTPAQPAAAVSDAKKTSTKKVSNGSAARQMRRA